MRTGDQREYLTVAGVEKVAEGCKDPAVLLRGMVGWWQHNLGDGFSVHSKRQRLPCERMSGGCHAVNFTFSPGLFR